MISLELLKKLYGDPSVSKCCKHKYFLQHVSEGESYFVCKRCYKPCETILKQPMGKDGLQLKS